VFSGAGCTPAAIPQSDVAIESAEVRISAMDRYAGSSFTPLAAIGTDGQDLPAVDLALAIDPIGDGTAECPSGMSMAVAGPLSRDGAYYDKTVLQSVTLAVRQFRAANSVEAYELAGIMIEGIRTGAATDRPTMVQWFKAYSG
jgi:hypothetical protein